MRGGREGEIYAATRALAERSADEIRRRYPKIPRRVSGYNLDELLPERGHNLARALVGSEGTLGVTLAATLRLVPRPRRLALVVLGFDDVYLAADQVPWILEHRPQALEGFDHHLPDFARAKGLDAVRLLPNGRAFLIVELGADSADDALAAAERLTTQARRVRACAGVAPLFAAAEQRAVWSLRESGLGAGALIPGHPRTWPGAEDTAVPPARLGDYLRRFVRLLDRHNLAAATYYGHFGEGCVHCRVNFDFTTTKGVETFRAAMLEIGDLVTEFGGSLSGEHGDGLARSELLPRMFGAQMIETFAEFKRIFDPDSMMNPGVIVAPHPLDSHLRVTPSYQPAQPETHFDFAAEGGLAGAALKCVGIGKCRKSDAGTMCPSYMATREEMHSTRGRAHLLWEALSGNGLLEGGLADPALKEALELCLSCKACKTECPAAIDMAAYKAEFFAQYYQHNRRPRDVRFFARIHELARIGAVAPHLANALSHAPGLGAIARRMLQGPSLPRTAALRRADVSFVVRQARRRCRRARRRCQYSRARGRALSRHLQQLFRARGRDRGDRGAGARGLQGRDSAGRSVLRAAVVRRRDVRSRAMAPGAGDGHAGAAARTRRGAGRARAELPAHISRRVAESLSRRPARRRTLGVARCCLTSFSPARPRASPRRRLRGARWCTGTVIRSRSPE